MSSGSSYRVLIEGIMEQIVQIVEKSVKKTVARSGDTPRVD